MAFSPARSTSSAGQQSSGATTPVAWVPPASPETLHPMHTGTVLATVRPEAPDLVAVDGSLVLREPRQSVMERLFCPPGALLPTRHPQSPVPEFDGSRASASTSSVTGADLPPVDQSKPPHSLAPSGVAVEAYTNPPPNAAFTSTASAAPAPFQPTPSTPSASSTPSPSPSSSSASSSFSAEMDPFAPKKRILIIYTGGTIGMQKLNGGALSPSKGFLQRTMANFPEIHHPDVPRYEVLEWEIPLDSSDFTPDCWSKLAAQIGEHYYSYDGFVILHGTDTMAYTSSALSFMLENLGKPVILTGSMIPIEDPISDAKRNLLVSLLAAAHLEVMEVLLFFNTHLFRGNRAKKVDPWRLAAMDSPNQDPLGTMGVGMHVQNKLRPPPGRFFSCHTTMYRDVIVMYMTPNFAFEGLRAVATHWRNIPGKEPPAIVLLMFGSGNAPINNPLFHQVMSTCLSEKCPMVIMSQCIRGSVDLTQYEAGARMARMGVIDGKDMTVEACVTKLSYLMGRGLRGDKLKLAMETDLRGELTDSTNAAYTAAPLRSHGVLAKL